MSEVDRLFQISNRTQTLVLERQRLAAFSPGSSLPASQLNQISRNLDILRLGIQDVENRGFEEAESVKSLRQQWIRMREMLGEEDVAVQDLAPRQNSNPPPPPKSPLLTTYSGGDPVHTPYADYPDSAPPSPPFEPHEMLGAQRQMMEDQDTHLDLLSQSINRQRDISIHIGSELEVHEGLLDDLDHSLDRTGSRMTSARRRLDRVARGTRDNASTVTIGLLIFILLILIVVFKT